MPAGSVSAPSIIPLRPPMQGMHKSLINSNIKIELWTETKDAKIYFTINGTRPDPFQKFGDKCTVQYRGPFTLPAGKQTVKALAIAGHEGERQSAVVTKTFDVQYVPPPEILPFDDDMEFQQDLDRERSKMELEKATADLLKSTKAAWAERIHDDKPDAAGYGRSQQMMDDSRYYKTQYPGMYAQQNHPQMPTREVMMPGYRPQDAYYLPEEYTTDAILALQDMNRNNRQDYLNYSTVTPGHHAATNEWMPTAYPHQSIRPPPNPYMPQPRPDHIDIPLNLLPPPTPPSHSQKKAEMRSTGSQTVGPFYPSQRRMEELEKEVQEKLNLEKDIRERKPLLTAFSPGKGFWRKQVEHIYQHLKAHAQNDAEFRALIGEPKMGKMIDSSIRDSGSEFSVTLTFSLRDSKGLFSGVKAGVTKRNGYNGHTPARHHYYAGSDDEIMSEDNYTVRSTASRRGIRRTTRRPKPKKKPASKVSSLDARLLRQLGTEGEGSSSEVQQLIDEGADPECESKTGLPALHLAARNQHIDCIYVLCGAGADVNVKGPSSRKGNTALHEAVSLGAGGLRTVDALLRCGADQNIKNDRGETAYEMATKAGYDNISKRFAAALGQSQLQKMIRPHSSVQ